MTLDDILKGVKDNWKQGTIGLVAGTAIGLGASYLTGILDGSEIEIGPTEPEEKTIRFYNPEGEVKYQVEEDVWKDIKEYFHALGTDGHNLDARTKAKIFYMMDSDDDNHLSENEVEEYLTGRRAKIRREMEKTLLNSY